MKTPAKVLTALLLGATVIVSAVPGFAQTADTPPPPAAAEQSDSADAGDDAGLWGFGKGRGHGEGRGHGGGHGRKGHDGKGHGGKGGRMMQIIDANADGAISEDEAASLADHAFHRMDQNDDATLDKTEFSTPPRHRRGGWFGGSSEEAAAVLKVRTEKFVTLDANADGKLDKTEFFAEARQRLAAADTDKDGKISPWEFRAQHMN